MRWRAAAAVLVWLAAVGVASWVAWLAIGNAGRQVIAVPVAVERTGGAGGRTSTPGAGVDGSAAGSPTRDPGPGPTRTAAGPRPVARTYTGRAGRLRVTCLGDAVSLRGGYAQPAEGWQVRVLAGGPREVEVAFLAGGRGVRVEAECAGGRPVFESRGFGWDGRHADDDRVSPSARE